MATEVKSKNYKKTVGTLNDATESTYIAEAFCVALRDTTS